MIEQKINTGNVHIQIREYPGNNSAVLFLHFGGGNMQMWRDVVPFFSDAYHVILLDLRGHGKSDRPDTGYHIDPMAQDVIAVMDELGVDRAHLIGSSLGAEVALSLAANDPYKALSLTCEGALFNEGGPYGLWEESEEKFQEHVQKTLEMLKTRPIKRYASVDEMVAESAQSFGERGWWNDVFEAVVRYDAVPASDGQWVKSWDLIAAKYLRHAFSYNFGEYYARVECPVLMLPDTYPGQDEKEVDIMQRLFALIADGKIVYVPEWVHPFGWMLTPESGSKAVLSFLETV